MRVVRAGSAIDFSFPMRVLPAVFYTALLALAFAGVVFLRGQQLAAAGPPPAQNPAQPAAHAEGAVDKGPDQEVGQLYQLATDLKTEVTKTDQNVLSLSVVRKATEIEQLAHKMRTGGGGR